MVNNESARSSGGPGSTDAEPIGHPSTGKHGDSSQRPDNGDGIHRGIAPDVYDVPTHIKPVRPWPKPGQSKDYEIHHG
jgi:hypothetical protein